jgi:leader peptidase (prepilin peptidase)/N-methyltransferase
VAVGAALSGGVVLCRGWSPWLGSQLVIVAVAPALTYTDVTARRLPNRILAPAGGASLAVLAWAAVCSGSATRMVTSSVIGMIVLLVFTLIAVFGDLGGGDAKLGGLIAMCLGPLGWRSALGALLLGFLFAAAGVALMAGIASLRRRPRPRTIPLGPYLLTASVAIVFTQAA